MPLTETIRIEKKITPALSSFIKNGKFSSCFIICDSNTLQFCLAPLVSSVPFFKDAEVIELEPGEESKSIEIAANVLETLTQFGADKKSLIVNLGGGVVSDLGGFCASIYKRGIAYINIPTSLLAMADASVGGKNGINFSGIKNLIGTITQPGFVFINTTFLRTLPLEHLRNGYAEILKIALITDKKFFATLEKLKIEELKDFVSIVKRSVELKHAITKKDPNDKSLRKILNFGHTFGHAIESLYLTRQETVLHGEAVAIGMAMECCLCLHMKRISAPEFKRIIDCLRLNFNFPQLVATDLNTFFRFFEQDKKHSAGKYKLALIKSIGKCDPQVEVSKAQIERAIRFYNSEIAE